MGRPVEEQEIGTVERFEKEGPREFKARYLIDQYNKLCSWRHNRFAIAISALRPDRHNTLNMNSTD